MSEDQFSLRKNLRTLPRGAWILFLGTFLNKFGTFVLPFLTIYLIRLGYTAAQAGLAIGAYGVGSIVACVAGGHLADRMGRRKTIVLSMFLGAFTMVCLSQAHSLPMIVLWSAVSGLACELYRPASSALLADLVPPEQRVTAYAAYRMALNAGFAFGPAVAGVLAKSSFLWLFLGDALTSILFGIVAWYALPAGLPRTAQAGSSRETFRVLVQDRRLQQVLLACLLVATVFVQMFSTLGLQITQRGFSTSTYGVLISLNGALVVLCGLPLASFAGRLPPRFAMAAGFMLIGLGFASNLWARTLPLLVLTVIMFTVGEMISMPVTTAYVANLAPEDRRGLYLGIYGMTWSLAFVWGPSLGTVLFAMSPSALWLSCAGLGVLAACIISYPTAISVARGKLASLPGLVAR